MRHLQWLILTPDPLRAACPHQVRGLIVTMDMETGRPQIIGHHETTVMNVIEGTTAGTATGIVKGIGVTLQDMSTLVVCYYLVERLANWLHSDRRRDRERSRSPKRRY